MRVLVWFLATLWCLWCTRNRILFKEEPFHPIMFFNSWNLLVRTADQAMDWVTKAKDDSGINENDVGENGIVWIRDSNPFHVVGTPSSCERIRIMVDASWKSVRQAGIGWVALTDTGSIFFEASKVIVADSATQAEALGVKEVLLWAKSSGYWHLEVSSDCLPIIGHLAGIEQAHHSASGTLDDIRFLCSFFHCLSFSFIPRSFNLLAHGLAYKAMIR
ncbi:uncharacterized protein LOC141629417 [Silene latifolia]|uniref:uncharacterized protein LOC141629417 n=1 Tax=Silene latifolia TaxID=37657 RepID=UPI003D781DDF